ncbi:MAG TPA: thiol-activated cytolysin family protein, partial [Bacteroidales bacterium]|nr:thiol-activated cytolysin family protein [Bacteroidales bacterium]
YVNTLSYNPDELLNVQAITAGNSERTAVDTVKEDPKREGGFNVSCQTEEYNLKANFEDVAILRPNDGIIYPGALVLGDADMLDGLPTPLQIERSPMTLRLDLPGMKDNGTIKVEDPTYSNVQAAIDAGLEWWNDNAYEEGYVNPSYISYQTSSSYSSQQLSIDVGLNVSWASTKVAAQFNYQSSSEKSVAMMAFKQGFYSVSLDIPKQPSDIFSASLSQKDIEGKIKSGAPPAYVLTVVYGRIIMFRTESSTKTSSADMKLAIEYAAGVNSVSGDMKTKIENILKNVSITAITIGGNADTASQVVSAQNFGDLQKIIKGKNAVYSKSNPGVPISYTIRYLKDNRLAKMGYTTNYKINSCSQTLVPGDRITVDNDAAFNIKFGVRYKDENNEAKEKWTDEYEAAQTRTLVVPDGAHDITLDVNYRSVGMHDLFERTFAIPERKCYRVSGDLWGGKHYGEKSCN